jgi:hypothetical protein
MYILSVVVNFFISPIHATFLKGGLITEGFVVLHEALNSIHVGKRKAMLLKLDFGKSYDKINDLFV